MKGGGSSILWEHRPFIPVEREGKEYFGTNMGKQIRLLFIFSLNVM